jgi:hypothetical protein
LKTTIKRVIPAWLLSIPFCYFGAGFLSNFYPAPYELTISAAMFNIGVVLFFYLTLPMLRARLQSSPFDLGIVLILLIALAGFGWTLFKMAQQFPSLFEAGFYHLEGMQWASFAIGAALALPASAWAASLFKVKEISETRLGRFAEENLEGLLLAFSFFSVYLFLVSIFNQPAFDADDIFFDADSRLWRWRFATEHTRDYYWRSVHPFVLIIIRPLVGLISLLLKGNTLFAAFVLVAFTGALCVFLVWYVVKHIVGNSSYAMLIAALFSASTAQLIFSSLIETYIFLAAVALVFIVLLIKDKPLYALVIAGLIAFGITISNFGQTVITHLVIKRNIKQWVIYGMIVAALVIPFTLLNNVVYPESQPYFFDLKSYEGEGHNQFPPTIQRANLLARVMFLHSFVAPEPLVREEEDIPFLKVWMFRASIKKDPMLIGRYETRLGRALVTAWIAFMALGAVLFLKNIRRQDNRFFLTFILILLFNFALHMRYGKDVFLYSTNWTYAIVLFLALAWKELAEKRWFQISLLVFIALMLVNNSQLIFTMLSTSALHIK